MKLTKLLIYALFIPSMAYADVDTPLNVREADGSPDSYPYQIKVSNGSMTDNGDGTVTVTTGGGSGETNTASNSGDAVGIFKVKVGVDLQFKSVASGDNIVITQDSNTVVLSTSQAPTFTTSVSTPTLTLTGTGTINGLDAIDATGEATLEAALDIAGDVSSTGMATTVIGSDKVLESMLKVVDSPADEDFLTYESTTGDFEWHSIADESLVQTTRTITVAGTANQVISSAGAQDLSTDRTWTLSTPQSIATSSAVTFATVDTGQGANELYDMNQNVLITSPVTFGDLSGDTVISVGKIIGNGNLDIKNGATTAGVLALFEDSDAGTNFASFQVPALAANTVYTLPTTDGAASEFLQSDGAGVLTWAAAGGGITTVGNVTSGTVAFDGTAGTTLTGTTSGLVLLAASKAGAGANVSLTGGASTNSSGGWATLQGGAGTGANDGGLTRVTGGTPGVDGTGGDVEITSGAGGATSGNGGLLSITGGSAPTEGDGGAVRILGGTAVGTNQNGGRIDLVLGASTGSGTVPSVNITQHASNVDGIALSAKINVASADITASDTFIDFKSSAGSIGSIAGTAVSGVIAYNTFLSGHYTQIEGKILVLGQVVELTGNVMPEDVPHLAVSRLCLTRASKKVYGVFSGKVASASTPTEIAEVEALKLSLNKGDLDKEAIEMSTERLEKITQGKSARFGKGEKTKDIFQVFGSGAGVVIVSNVNGNITTGDLLEADGLGNACKQTDDIIRSSTIGKAVVDVVWAGEPKTTKLIGAILYAG